VGTAGRLVVSGSQNTVGQRVCTLGQIVLIASQIVGCARWWVMWGWQMNGVHCVTT